MSNSYDENTLIKRHFTDSLKLSDIRFLISGVIFFTFSSRALAVVIGFQIYKLTHSALMLGWLGLIEAVPAIGIAPFGGYVADHFNRRRILLTTRFVSCLCALSLALLSISRNSSVVIGLFLMVFLAGVARGFSDPASTAFEAQVVPKRLTVNASSWISSSWIISAVLGPAVIGFVFDAFGAHGSYVVIAVGFVLSFICMLFIKPKSNPVVKKNREPILKSIYAGWKYVFKSQPLIVSMALDLFAVFFGGAIALLPIYASDILCVGAKGLGLLNAASFLGAFLVTLCATHYPPIAKAGRNLLWSVAGFGISIIIFAFSRNFWLSMVCLFLSGVFDGISVVIRRSIIRLLSPDNLRGRIASVNSIFICASNELGAFESGMGAALVGTIPCVALGGVATILIVSFTAVFAKELRGLSFNAHTLEQK